MARADSLTALAEAAALQEAFPSYTVHVCVRRGGRPRFEVVTRDDGNPWCLISPVPSEIWRELVAIPSSLDERVSSPYAAHITQSGHRGRASCGG